MRSSLTRPAVLGCSVLVLAAMLTLGSRPAGGQAGPSPAAPPAAIKIGVLELAQVFERYEKTKELEKRINEQRDRLKEGLKEQRDKVKEITKEMDLLDFDSETYKLKEEERYIETAKLELLKKRLERSIKTKWEEYNLQLLEDIETVVREYGDKNGFTLILKVEGEAPQEKKLPLYGLKNVMYFAKETDITPDVIELLNQRYKVGEDG